MNHAETLRRERTAHLKRIVEIDKQLAAIGGTPVAKCCICGDPITMTRAERHPRAITCSHECSIENLRKLRRANAKRAYERKKEAAGKPVRDSPTSAAVRVSSRPTLRLAKSDMPDSSPRDETLTPLQKATNILHDAYLSYVT